jgi:hypothetical protein
MKMATASLMILMLALMTGCSNKFDECVAKEKESYRSRNPGASSGQVQTKQDEFEMLCSSFKGK